MTLTLLPEPPAAISAPATEVSELFDVQLSVARRADVLARRWRTRSQEEDRRAWLQAELETFQRLERRQARPRDAA